MAKDDNKRFYWLKLKNDFFKRKDNEGTDAIQLLLRQPDGSKYVCIYLMLCLESVNKNGLLYYEANGAIIPWTIDDIKVECKYYEPSEVECAVNQFLTLGLITTVEVRGQITFAMPDVPALVGSETGAAARMRLQRSGQLSISSNAGTQ